LCSGCNGRHRHAAQNPYLRGVHWQRAWPTLGKSPRVSPRSTRRSGNRRAARSVGASPSCSALRASLLYWGTRLTPPQITSGESSTGHGGKARCPGNYAPPPASPGCGATKVGAKLRAICSHPSTIDLPRASKLRILRSRRQFWTASPEPLGRDNQSGRAADADRRDWNGAVYRRRPEQLQATGSCHRASLIHPILEPHLTVLHRFLTRPVAAPAVVQA